MEHKDHKVRKAEDGSEKVIGALIEVHRALGPGLLESAHEAQAFDASGCCPSPFLIFPIFLSVLSGWRR